VLSPAASKAPSSSSSASPSSSSSADVNSNSNSSSSSSISDAEYEALLEKGRANTLDHPSGQLLGRAGRRCALEDGERFLERAVRARPSDLRARVLLLRNLMRQATGREAEVPGLALQALRDVASAGGDDPASTAASAALEACSTNLIESPECVPALQLALLALKALHAQRPPPQLLEEDANAADAAAAAAAAAAADAGAAAESAVDAWRARRLRAFVEAAGDVVPGLAGEFGQVERRLRLQLEGLGASGDDARLRALASRDWLSAVDLAPPCGVVG